MRHEIVQDLIDTGAVAVVRVPETTKLLRAIEAIRAGGITAIEITMTTPDALDVIEAATTAFNDDPDVRVGVGSVLDATTTQQAIGAGARFVVSPILDAEVIETSHRYDVPVIPGAFTPTEVSKAHELGADIVKVFPASALQPEFIQALHGPMPHVNLMPTGGVTVDTCGDWIEAGACSLGVGSALMDPQIITEENYAVLRERAEQIRSNVEEARS